MLSARKKQPTAGVPNGACRDAEEDEGVLAQEGRKSHGCQGRHQAHSIGEEGQRLFQVLHHQARYIEEAGACASAAKSGRATVSIPRCQALQQGTAGNDVGNACRLLELPLPEMDDLDRVTWNVSSAEVSKAYR